MLKEYIEPEDLLSDESFLSWHFKSDPRRAEDWEQWMNAHPDRQPLVQQAIDILDHLRMAERDIPDEQVLAAENSLHEKLAAVGEKPGAAVFSLARKTRWVAAASILLLVTAGFFIARSRMVIKPQLATTYGEIRQQRLPDGTEVYINANSHISYTEGWKDGKDREVWIRGEAFFHVRKTPGKSRFIVHADPFDIIVTGTQFNVLNRNGRANVMLKEGSVIVHSPDGKELHMVPGEFVEFNANVLQKRPARNDSVVAWKEHKLIFDNTSMSEVVRIIRDHYGVKIGLENAATGDKTISGILPNDNLDILLQALEATTEFQITRKEDTITIATH